MSDIEARVIEVLDGLGGEYEVVRIDPQYADTAEFCSEYGYQLGDCGNTIVVASKRPRGRYSVCIVRGSDRLDVNKTVKRLMGVSRLSFASLEETVQLTGMEIGGVTPFALTEEIPIYVDDKLMNLDYVILGSGDRLSKIKASPRVLRQLPNAEIIVGLSLEMPSGD